MREDRANILRMIAEGKVTPEEGDELLSALEPPARGPMPPPRPPGSAMGMPMPPSMPYPSPAAANMRRKFVIHITEDGEPRVHISIPLSLARAAGKLIPRDSQRYLNERGIQLEELLSEIVNVEGDGMLVQIQDEDTEIRIGLE